jgi:hypothetical protein
MKSILWKFGLAMRVSVFRNLVCWVLSLTFPLSLSAADPTPAMLHSQGGVWINGSEAPAPASTAIFAGDLLETKAGSIANLDLSGSSVLIQPESVVKFNGDYLTLEHGSVAVGTSQLMRVHVNCLRVIPVSNDWTQYEVTDTSGSVQVAARKNDVNITQAASLRKPSAENAASRSATVHEGQQVSREESEACGVAERPSEPTHGPNAKWMEIGGGTGGGVLLICLLVCKGSPPKTVSPSQP